MDHRSLRSMLEETVVVTGKKGGWESMTIKWLQHRDFRGLELAVELQESIYMSLYVFKRVKLLLLLCYSMKKKKNQHHHL